MTIKNNILIAYQDTTFQIPNAWELLTPEQYLNLYKNIQLYSDGQLSVGMVKILYICDIMGWNPRKIKEEDSLCNLSMLADQVTFIFNIVYHDDVLKGLSDKEKSFFSKVIPERSEQAIARYLSKQDYFFALDSCFCAQLVPKVIIDGYEFQSYNINNSFGTLTCSLVAIQYLEAKELLGGKKEQLPLLASILFQRGPYDSAMAHDQAVLFASLPEYILEAIAFNFLCFNNYLFRKTEYRLLTEGKPKHEGAMSIGATASLYNLCSDGYGDINTIEQINILEFLSINRKKTIETVRSLNESKLKITEISDNTGLPIHIINEILK
jgi:hypothetical protein